MRGSPLCGHLGKKQSRERAQSCKDLKMRINSVFGRLAEEDSGAVRALGSDQRAL